ncbi:MAG: hypothetical protein Fur0027_07180 [Raineya sp.]
MPMQFKVDYNPSTEQPELVISYDADATRLDEKLFERFLELIATKGASVSSEATLSQGVKTARISVSLP